MCRPRAATSVATSSSSSPFWKLLQQRLALLLRHVAGQHADLSRRVPARATRSANALVLTKTMPRAVRRSCATAGRAAAGSSPRGRVVQLLAHARRGDGLGFDDELFRLVHVLVGELQHAVAERGREQQVWRSVRTGMRRSRKRMSLMKPRSNMRSASSSTHISQACSDTACCLTKSIRRPGVAMITSAPSLQQAALLVVVHAAVDQGERRPRSGRRSGARPCRSGWPARASAPGSRRAGPSPCARRRPGGQQAVDDRDQEGQRSCRCRSGPGRRRRGRPGQSGRVRPGSGCSG
jgi:hypothetical protein